MLGTAKVEETSLWATFNDGLPHMNTPVLVDQQKH